MRKLLIIIASSMMLMTNALADTCPTVYDIQNNRLHSWQLYDSDSHKPISMKHITKFKKYAKQFTLAEWHKDNHQNMIRCYYRDLNGSEAQAYLAKTNLHPKLAENMWYSVSGSLHCAAGRDRCMFQNAQSSHQFAKK